MEEVDFKIYESDMTRFQTRFKRLSWVIWFEIILIVGTNAAWLIYEILRRFG